MAETIRLNKVLRELNISLDRAVEFLDSKGIEIEKRPTTKISEDTYNILSDEFETDANKKIKSQKVSEAKLKEKEDLRIKREQELEDKQKAEEAKEKARQDEVVKASKTLSGPKQVGKIDLDSNKPKPVTQDKKPTEEPASKEEEKAEVPKAKEEPKTEKPSKPETKKVEIDGEMVVPEEQVKTQYQKLSGPKIAGDKIDLSQFNKPKKKKEEKKADSKSEDTRSSSKRKRLAAKVITVLAEIVSKAKGVEMF